MLAKDQEDEMRRPILSEAETLARRNEEGQVVQPWRVGPAKIWYDMMKLPTTSQQVNYGFKLKVRDNQLYCYQSYSYHFQKTPTPVIPRSSPSKAKDPAEPTPCSSSSQVEVVDKSCGPSVSEDVLLPYQVMEWEKDVILDGEAIKDKLLEEFTSGRGCGWVATQFTRTYEHFVHAGKLYIEFLPKNKIVSAF